MSPGLLLAPQSGCDQQPAAGCLAPLSFHFLFCKVEEELIKSHLVLRFSFMLHQSLTVSRSLFPLFPGMIFCSARWEQMGWAGSYCEVRRGEGFGPGSLSLPEALSLCLWEWSPRHRVTRNVSCSQTVPAATRALARFEVG